jgi:nicotinamide-nucleotide amidase
VIADIICVGNELLTGLIENTNSGFLARRLWSAGIPVREVTVVADDEKAIHDSLSRALLKSDLVILTGGLGPTDDDLTREVVASFLQRKMVLNKKWLERMENFFSARGITMPQNNSKQAMVIEGSIILENDRGTAPGALIENQGKSIIILPGPPHELQNMFDRQAFPYININRSGIINLVKTLKCIGIGESLLEEKIKTLGRWKIAPISYVARGLEVDLQIKGSGNLKSAAAEICDAEKAIRELLGEAIFGTDNDTLTGVVAELLRQKNKSLAVAESCSGGQLSDQITDTPGSSDYYRGGIIAYSMQAKENLLGLPSSLLQKEGAVSEKTATEMAKAVRKLFNSDIGIGITGLAGPDSDESNKPVGLVYIAVSNQEECRCSEYTFGGGRRAIKERSSQLALNLLRLMLLQSKNQKGKGSPT